MVEERTLTCRKCGAEFIFSESEQAFYAEKGFVNGPKRCPECRVSVRALEAVTKPKKAMFTVICADCGKETQIPFNPRGDKPVYCKDCFSAHKGESK